MRNLTINQFIVSLIKSGLDGSVAEVPSDVDWNLVVQISTEHKLMPLVYQGISNSQIEVPSEVQAKIDELLLAYFLTDSKQLKEISKIEKAFESSGIDYMPVKGILLKPLYPSSDFRPMGDGDILIKMSQKDLALEVMSSIGFSFSKESPHEFICGKPGVCIELHKCLIPPYNKDYYALAPCACVWNVFRGSLPIPH